MEEKNNNEEVKTEEIKNDKKDNKNVIIVILVVIVLLLGVFIALILTGVINFKGSNQGSSIPEKTIVDNQVSEKDEKEKEYYIDTSLKNADIINNYDIKKLLNVVRRTNSYQNNYLETPLSKVDGSVLLTVVINNIDADVREKYMKEMSQKMINDIVSQDTSFSEDDKLGLLYEYFDYDSNKLFANIKEIFGKDKKEIMFEKSKLSCFNYSYITSLDVIYYMENCGGPVAYYNETVQSYDEFNNDIIVITEINALEYDDMYDKDVDGKKLKYTFKKNDFGKYYVNEIESFS